MLGRNPHSALQPMVAGVLICTTTLAGGHLVKVLPGTPTSQGDGTISPPWASFKVPREETLKHPGLGRREGILCPPVNGWPRRLRAIHR